MEFPNLDDTYHNVFSYSKTKRFDLGRYRKERKARAWSCSINRASLPLTAKCTRKCAERSSSWKRLTSRRQISEGRYRLEHLPAGHYVLTAWISDKDVRTQPVEFKANDYTARRFSREVTRR